MGLLATLGLATTETTTAGNTDDSVDRRARCRGCGRYYALELETCPHCDSGNKIRSGAPNGQTRR